MNHIPLALLIQACTAYFFGWWAGAAAGIVLASLALIGGTLKIV